jgi:hypothetical protein
VAQGRGRGPRPHNRFYDEYLAVMDMTAEFYLSTVERIFKDREIARNTFVVDGHKVDIGKITRCGGQDRRGRQDDISAPGQCIAALDLLTGLPDREEGEPCRTGGATGHYGIFAGRSWRDNIRPLVLDFIDANNLGYDTPDWNGFSLAAAYGREVLQDNNDNDYTDIALRYGGGTDIWDYAAGAGYNWTSGSGSTSEFWSGSGSVLHKPTGLSGTLAAGGNSGGTSYWYGKLGLGRDVWSIGATALSVDYYAGSGFETTGSNTTSWSVAGVQEFDSINLEYYLVYRNYAYQDSTAGYQDGQVFMTGLRWIW